MRAAGARRLVAGLLLAWCAAILAREATAAFRGWRGRSAYRATPALWHFGTPQTDWLARCLAAADAAVEPGSRILLLGRDQDFYRERWAAYLLPAHDLLPAGARPQDADLVVALPGVELPGARLVGGGGRCRLLRPAAPAS